MLYFGLYVQLRRGSVAGYTTDESWAYGPKEGVEAFESITFFIRFHYCPVKILDLEINRVDHHPLGR